MPKRALPPIPIEAVSVERSPGTTEPTLATGLAVDVRPPGHDVVIRLLAFASMIRGDYVRTIGVYRGFHPRRESRVEHRVGRSAAATISAVCGRDELRVEAGPLRLTCDTTHTVYDARGHEYRLPGRLHLPLSWPELPIVLSVGEVSSTECKLGVSLHSRKRVRYPLRYFHSAHRLLTKLASSGA